MNPQQIKTATKVTLGLGALGTIGFMAYAGGGPAALLQVGWFGLWAVLPYAVLLASLAFAGTRGRTLAVWIVSLLASGFAFFVYYDAFAVHTGSMNGLFFLFIPIWQLLAAVILLACLFFTRRSDAKRNV